MVQKRKYVCNFCRAEHEDQSAVVGVKWDWAEKLVKDAPIQVENHLCYRCLRAITDFGNAQLKNNSAATTTTEPGSIQQIWSHPDEDVYTMDDGEPINAKSSTDEAWETGRCFYCERDDIAINRKGVCMVCSWDIRHATDSQDSATESTNLPVTNEGADDAQ